MKIINIVAKPQQKYQRPAVGDAPERVQGPCFKGSEYSEPRQRRHKGEPYGGTRVRYRKTMLFERSLRMIEKAHLRNYRFYYYYGGHGKKQ